MTTTNTFPAPTGTSKTNHYTIARGHYDREEIIADALRAAAKVGGTLVDVTKTDPETMHWEAVVTVWSA
jgi:hypothetical protein